MAFDWTSLLGTGANALANIYVGNKTANAQAAAGQEAAQSAQFRPVGITTRFGKSGFQYDPATGQLTGAGYQVAPDVAAMREGLMGLAGTGLSQAQQAQALQPQVSAAGQGLFNLGQQYVGQNPQEVAQNWMNQQQQLLAPSREQQLAQLTNQQQQQGRMGLATGGTSAGYAAGAQGLAATNPQMAAYYNAKAQQDAQLAAQAQMAGQQQVQFGQGLMSGGLNLQGQGYGLQTSALSPFSSYYNQAANLENQAANALSQGASLGSSQATAAANAAKLAYAGNATAAETQQIANQAILKQLQDPIAKLIGSLSGNPTSNYAAVTNPYFTSIG